MIVKRHSWKCVIETRKLMADMDNQFQYMMDSVLCGEHQNISPFDVIEFCPDRDDYRRWIPDRLVTSQELVHQIEVK